MELDHLSPKMKMLLSSFPIRNEDVEWVEEDESVVLIYPKNFSRFERFLHRHVGGPDNIRRLLDDKGTFIWKRCDGKHNIHDICSEIHNEFREDIEPVVKRVWGFLEILHGLNLITFEVPEEETSSDKNKGEKTLEGLDKKEDPDKNKGERNGKRKE